MLNRREWSVLFYLMVVLFSTYASGNDRVPVHRYSAIRMKGEPARHAYGRYMSRLSPFERGFFARQSQDTALGVAKHLPQLDPSTLPDFGRDKPSVVRAFEKVRDIRFLKDPDQQGFMRRSSWMYPDDGCFARAALMVQNMTGSKLPSPGKVFIFGDLTVKTPNSPEGEVGWWYHVVPGFRMGQAVVVFDPAIDPTRPLLLADWIRTMTDKPDSVTLSFCDPNTYVPSDPCHNAQNSQKDALSSQLGFLGLERERLESLHRDTARELGEFPPWRNPGWY